jgi:hypothetical protein
VIGRHDVGGDDADVGPRRVGRRLFDTGPPVPGTERGRPGAARASDEGQEPRLCARSPEERS